MSEATQPAEPYILFELAGATYGLPSRLVRHVEMVEQVTPVPNAPACVEGVVSSRGKIIPALSLRLRFGFPRVPHSLRTRLIVVQSGDRTVGMLADSAREFVSIAPDAIRPPPSSAGGLGGAYLAGVAALGERLVLILDSTAVLDIS